MGACMNGGTTRGRVWRRATLIVVSLATVLALLAGVTAAKAGPPDGFEIRTVVTGLNEPIAFAYAPDGRIFIAEKSGLVKVWSNGQLTTFLDIQDETNAFSDRGLLGIALDPDFATNGWVYVGFVLEPDEAQPDRDVPATNHIIRIRASAANPNVADGTTGQTVLSGMPQAGPWHTIGQLTFDDRRNLLVGLGDDSCYYPGFVDTCTLDVLNPDSPIGKVLRFNPDTRAGDPRNPYYNEADPTSTRSQVLALGLRNPYRFSIDAPTGDIWVGDVGNADYEEINRIPASPSQTQANYGWPCYEGGNGVNVKQPDYSTAAPTRDACNALYSPAEGGTGPGATPPIFAWAHRDIAGGHAVLAGPVYRGADYPSTYVGRLFFANYVSGVFLTRTPDGTVTEFGTPDGFGNPTDMRAAPNGNIAYTDYSTGTIREIVDLDPNDPPRTPDPTPDPPVRNPTPDPPVQNPPSQNPSPSPNPAPQIYRCDGRIATIVGTPRNDVITGTDGPDVIVALGGNDIVHGLGGDDRICLGAGNDTAIGGSGNDRIFGGAGNDRILGGSGHDHLDGGAGRDTIHGDAGHDGVIGGAGNDLLYGDAGDDTLTGGDGNDRAYGGPGNDRVFGGRGNDLLVGGPGADRLVGNAGRDRLIGGTGADTCSGEARITC